MKWIWTLILATQSAQADLFKEGGDWFASPQASVSSYSSNIELYQERRMGVGVMAAGPMGLIGFQWQLNFIQDMGITLGYGTSRGFRSFNIDIRQYLGTKSFTPFLGGGYSRWTGTGKPTEQTSPAFVADRFLSARERQTGEFAENILYPSVGVQYFQLDGELAGLSFIAEIIYAIDTEDFVAKPYGGIGTMYYF